MEAETDTEVVMVVFMDMVVEVMAEVEAAVEVMGEAEGDAEAEVVEAVEVETEVNKVCLLTGPSQNRFKKSNTLFKEPETSQLMILMSLLSSVT